MMDFTRLIASNPT